MALGGAIVGTALVRIQPSLAGFGATVAGGLTSGTAAAALARGGAAASLLITAPIVAGLSKAVSTAVSQESAFAGVKKTVNATAGEYTRLKDSVTDLSNAMPFAFEQVASVMEEAGRFGIPTQNLKDATELFLKLGTAIPDMDPAQAAEQLTRLSNILGVVPDDMDKMASSLVALGNDFPTTESAILSMSMRIAGAAEVVGMADSSVLAWAASLSSLGVRAEMGGSAISRVFLTINDAVKGGTEELGKFAEIAGMSGDEFSKLFATSPDQAVLAFVTGLNKLGAAGENLNPILKDLKLGEIRVRDVLLRASSNPELIAKALATAKTGFEENIALNREYEKRLDTTAAKWQIVKNRFNNAFAALGEALLPILTSLMEALTPIIELVTFLAEAFAKLPAPMQQVLLVMALVAAALGPLALILPRLVTGFKLMGAALDATKMAALGNPWVILALALVALVTLVVIHWDTIKRVVGDALEWIGGKLEEFGMWIAEWYINNVQPIVDWFRDTWDKVWMIISVTWDWIVQKFNTAMSVILPIIDAILHPMDVLRFVFDALKIAVGAAWDWIVQKFNTAKDAIIAACREIADAVDKAMGPVDEFIGGVVGFTGKLFGFDKGGVVPGPRGAPRLVMAHGGETFLPTHKGPVTVAASGSSGGGDFVVQGPLVSLQGVVIRQDADITALAKEIERERQRVMRAKGK